MKEALKLALEAMEFIPESGSMLGAHAEAKRLEAIIAIKQALAQDETSSSRGEQKPIPFGIRGGMAHDIGIKND